MIAVLTGDITERFALGPVEIDAPCPYCGADIVLAHEDEVLRAACSSCEGTFRGERPDGDAGPPHPPGTITALPFPPRGVGDRTPVGVLEAALSRFVARNRQVANGVCPDCGGPAELRMQACPEHDDEGVCSVCGSRFAGVLRFSCGTCGQSRSGVLALLALDDPTFHTYFFERGYNFVDPTWGEVVVALNMSERVHGVDPLEFEAVWTVDGESLSMHADGERGAVTVARSDRP